MEASCGVLIVCVPWRWRACAWRAGRLIQRAELTPIEEAHAYQQLLKMLQFTQDQLGQRLGMDRSTIANSLRLLRLPAEVQALVNEGRLDSGHGRALLSIDGADVQIRLAREAVHKELSVRDVERRVFTIRQASAPRRGAPEQKDANTRAAEERLRATLGTRVDIRRRGRGGTLEIAFANEAELNRLFEWLIRRPVR